MWIHKPFFQYATGIILTILIILLFGKIDYFLWPFQKTIATIFFPVAITGLLYYISRPIVRFLGRYMPKLASIILVFTIVIGLLTLGTYFAGPVLSDQLGNLSEEFPDKMEKFTETSEKTLKDHDFGLLQNEDLRQKAVDYGQKLLKNMSGNLMTVFSTITSIATVLIIVPFLLFYFLKDDDKLRPFLLKYIPNEVEDEGNVILKDVDKTLSAYIIGQTIIALADGIMMYIGYVIIGLDYALILALFAMCLIIVPFLGPFLGVIPALLVGVQQDPIMAVKVLVILLVVQQLEGNLITPNVMGKKLNIHPVTVILLLLAAGTLYGFIGILIAIPLYAVIKTLVKNFRKFYRLRQGPHKI